MSAPANGCLSSGLGMPVQAFLDGGHMRVLAIDDSVVGAEDALLAAAALARLEPGLQEQARTPSRASPSSSTWLRPPSRGACWP